MFRLQCEILDVYHECEGLESSSSSTSTAPWETMVLPSKSPSEAFVRDLNGL